MNLTEEKRRAQREKKRHIKLSVVLTCRRTKDRLKMKSADSAKLPVVLVCRMKEVLSTLMDPGLGKAKRRAEM